MKLEAYFPNEKVLSVIRIFRENSDESLKC